MTSPPGRAGTGHRCTSVAALTIGHVSATHATMATTAAAMAMRDRK